MVSERIRLAVGNVIDVHESPREGGREVQPYLDFVRRYLQDTFLRDLTMQIYDTDSGQMIYSLGEKKRGIPTESVDHERIELPDGSLVIRLVDTDQLATRTAVLLFKPHLSRWPD